MKFFVSLFVFQLFFILPSFAQIREIPAIVEETFANQYPRATHIDFKDFVVKVQVHFEQDGELYMATYTNKGLWKGTEKAYEFDKLSDTVKDGFQKSKYADDNWEIEETAILYLPGGSEQYRVLVRKNDVQKKYLFFNDKGRLLRTAVTL
ncbi:MAG: hypothetical protein GC171_00745 [Terrimonas sp.]|nr:hypothetical protein [Terrimonas sp.]